MQYCRPGKLEIPAGRALYGWFNGLTLQRIAVMVETKSNALPLERGKALPTQNRGITAEWQGNKPVSYTHLDVYKRQFLHRLGGWSALIASATPQPSCWTADGGMGSRLRHISCAKTACCNPGSPAGRGRSHSLQALPCLLYTSRCV